MTYTITGREALRLSERDDLTIHAAPCAIIPEGGPVRLGTAQQIAKDDPSLLSVRVELDGWWDGHRGMEAPTGYAVGDYFWSDGQYAGPDDDGVEPTWRDAESDPNDPDAPFRESINWEWVHAHHPEFDGPVGPGPWLDRIIAHARQNGFAGEISPAAAADIVNRNLW